ncbi:MAG: glycosyltransferase family 4 protein [Endomicrobiales bacterium]|nr:glycosyltransferase family 4 protein [Endomicrobiales bacterium]
MTDSKQGGSGIKEYTRTVMLTSRYYPVEGGAEKQCRRMSGELVKKGKKVVILTQKVKNALRHEKTGGVEVFRLGIALNNRIGSLVYFISGLSWLARRLREFDVVHAHVATVAGVIAAVCTMVFRKPSVLKVAGSRNTGDVAIAKRSWHGRMKLSFLAKNITFFVCPSAEVAEELKKTGVEESRIGIIPNGIDNAEFYPLSKEEKGRMRAKLGLPEKSRIFLYAGRLEKGKGIEDLIVAWGRLEQEKGTDGKDLVVIGDGRLMEKTKLLASGLKNVIFTGWKTETKEYLQSGDSFILPSYGEGMPNSLIEAMACGLVCIASDIGGISEMISDGENGLLVRPGDSDGLYGAICRVLELGDENEISKNARKHTVTNLGIGLVADRYIGLYNRLSAVKKPA